MFPDFKNKKVVQSILRQIEKESTNGLRFMEVCGTHTVAFFRSGVRDLLPKEIIHLSGPGCPVCVTHDSEIATFFTLAKQKNIIICTFGDLMKVPGPEKQNLKHLQAEGAQIKIVYSPMEALEIAQKNPKHEIVFLGVGFETTAPTTAATIFMAHEQKILNFSVLAFHKTVPPALNLLLSNDDIEIDALLLPGHVSVIIGTEPYHFLETKFKIPSVVAGFEPIDILQGVLSLLRKKNDKSYQIENLYPWAVNKNGNQKAKDICNSIFITTDAPWRGLGNIPNSGLAINKNFSSFDAMYKFNLKLPDIKEIPGCKCGDVLKGKIFPPQCPLYGKTCIPSSPVGPCMVSSEGSCAAYYKYYTE